MAYPVTPHNNGIHAYFAIAAIDTKNLIHKEDFTMTKTSNRELINEVADVEINDTAIPATDAVTDTAVEEADTAPQTDEQGADGTTEPTASDEHNQSHNQHHSQKMAHSANFLACQLSQPLALRQEVKAVRAATVNPQ